MPLLDRQGHPLSKNDAEKIVSMLKGAYANHVEAFNRQGQSSQLAQVFIAAYEKRIQDLEKDYMDKFTSTANWNLDEILNLEFKNTNDIAREDFRIKNNFSAEDFRNYIDSDMIDGGFYYDHILGKGDSTGINPPGDDEDATYSQDTKEAYNLTESPFKLADEPWPGIEEIINYNPNSDRIRSLHEPRSGNSTTLASNNENVRNKGIFSFDSGAELSRIKASELMAKMARGENIGFGDLFDVFSSLNEFARLGDPEGGTIRSTTVSAGNIKGVSAFKAPSRLYKTLDKAAACINQIKDMQDLNLKKTRALQIASFVYSMTLSEHVFADGNGRSCRLLADTILQSFGLPPHIPNETTKSKEAVATIGDVLNFNVSAQGFFEGILKSSDILRNVQAAETQARQEREAAELLERERELQDNHDRIQTARNVWDEIIGDTTVPIGMVALAEYFKKTSLDVSDPAMLRLLTHYNKESGKVETLKLIGHKPEEDYPSPTGFTNTKQGAMDFLLELDSILDQDDLYNYNEMTKSDGVVKVFTTINKRDVETYKYGAYSTSVKRTDDPFNVKEPAPVSEPTRFMRFMHAVFGGYKAQFESYNTYLTKKADYDRDLAAYNAKNKALLSFADNNNFTIQKSKQALADYDKVEHTIQESRTIDEQLEVEALTELDAQKTIDVITGRKKVVLGSSPNHRTIISTELEKADDLPMEGLALIAVNSIEINRSINDGSTQYPQELEFKKGYQYTQEDEKFRKTAEMRQTNVNVAAKVQDSLFSGKDSRMGERFTAVIESRKRLNEAAREYRAGNKQPLVHLLKDSLPPIFSNLKSQASTVASSSGKALIEMADALHQLLDNDPDLKQQLQIPDDDLNKLYAASTLVKEIVYPKQRRNEAFKKYMAEGAEDKVSYVKEMLYSSYLANTLETQVSNRTTEAGTACSNEVSAAIDKYMGNLVAAGPYKRLYGEAAVNITISIAITDGYMKYPDIYSKFQTEEGINSVKRDFENQIVNSPEFNQLLTKSREELARMDFAKELKTILEKNKERQRANEAIKVNQPINNQPANVEVQPEIIEVQPMQEVNVKGIPGNILQNDPILNNIMNGPKSNQLEERMHQLKESKGEVHLENELNVPDFGKKTEQNVEKNTEKIVEFTNKELV